MPNLRPVLATARCNRPSSTCQKPSPSALSARSLALLRQARHVSTSTSTSSPESGTLSPHPPSPTNTTRTSSPFFFSTGYALFAKRRSRPFPPPFLSLPNTSFSDPLSTHHRSKDGRNIPHYEGEIIRGITNGDDAVLVSETMIAANDGVGAWATKEKGHAALWARLIVHFWALEAGRDGFGSEVAQSVSDESSVERIPNMQGYLRRAFEHTQSAVGEWLGTSTASGVLIHHTSAPTSEQTKPLLYVTHLGDSQILVIRPGAPEPIFKTVEQWHWFDCPRQLGTNSPDTPDENAVSDTVEVEIGDVVLAMSDGVVDNLFEAELIQLVVCRRSTKCPRKVMETTTTSGRRR
jgi:serine/threonine protein phosphatase PrpC